MAGILVAKSVQLARTVSGAGVSTHIIRPNPGKIWWFKSMRIAVALSGSYSAPATFRAHAILRLQKTGAVGTIDEYVWTNPDVDEQPVGPQTLSWSTELTSAGTWASYDNYIQFRVDLGANNGGSATTPFAVFQAAFLGLEADTVAL